MTTTDWVEVIVPVAAAEVDELAALLVMDVAYAAAGTEIRGDEIVFWAPLAETEAAVAAAREAVARWQGLGAGADPVRVRSQPALPEAEWRDAWKRYFHVSRLTRQLVVVPSWETFTAAPDDVVIDLDPGMAFGTGTHASTRLVLEELQRLADAGVAPAELVDVGAGSGILSIAAVKLWRGARSLALDNDPIAVDACRDNARHNHVDDVITSALTPIGEVAREFPLVLANIQAHVLRELKAALVASCAPGATIILSGLLTPQAPAVADEYVAAGLELVAMRPSTDDPQWSSVVLKRP